MSCRLRGGDRISKAHCCEEKHKMSPDSKKRVKGEEWGLQEGHIRSLPLFMHYNFEPKNMYFSNTAR